MNPSRILTTVWVLLGTATAAWANPELTLTADDSCYQVGATVTVNVDLSNGPAAIVGGQFFLSYDNTKLTFVSADPASSVWTREVSESIAPGAGTIDYAVGIEDEGTGAASGTMAVLTFTAAAEVCNTAGLVSFRTNDPPTTIVDENDVDYSGGTLDVNDLSAVSVDSTDPSVTCPSAFSVQCTGGVLAPYANLTAFLAAGGTASDNCDTSLTLSLTSDSGLVGGICGGTVTRVYRVTDDCDHFAECTQIITVNDTTNPSITCPGNFSVQCTGGVPAAYADLTAFLAAGGTASDNCDPSLTLSLTSDSGLVGGICGGTVTRVYRVTDDCNNFAECTQVITVNDTTNPTIACPAGFSVQCAGDVPAAYADLAAFQSAGGTASDNCDPSLTLSLTSDSGLVGGGCGGTVTRVYRVTDDCNNFAECTQVITVNDNTAPTITFCPPSIGVAPVVYAEAGTCAATLSWPDATATDNCAMHPTEPITYWIDAAQITSPYAFPSGTTTVTVKAKDACGNINDTCTFDVSVSEFNEMKVSVQLQGVNESSLTRCITFELWNCTTSESEIVTAELEFTNGLAADKIVLVSCLMGPFTCVTARDTLHTLRRTQTDAEGFGIVGTQYAADFTGDPASGGDWLTGGNLNDDKFVDIIDFGIYVNRYGTNYGTGQTGCAAPPPYHADINGNGMVSTGDFTFVQINFLKAREDNCCGAGNLMGGPFTSITCAELRSSGLGELVVADLNRDGVLNQWDIVAFANGARPRRTFKETQAMEVDNP